MSFILLSSTETCRINFLQCIYKSYFSGKYVFSSSKPENNQVSGVIFKAGLGYPKHMNILVGQCGMYEVSVWMSPNWITVDSGLLCSEIITKLISKTHVHEELLKKK